MEVEGNLVRAADPADAEDGAFGVPGEGAAADDTAAVALLELEPPARGPGSSD